MKANAVDNCPFRPPNDEMYTIAAISRTKQSTKRMVSGRKGVVVVLRVATDAESEKRVVSNAHETV